MAADGVLARRARTENVQDFGPIADAAAPPLPSRALEGPWLGRTREIYKGPVRVGRDGDMISLPAGSRDIRYSDRLSFIR